MKGTISLCVLMLTLVIVSTAFAGTNYNCKYTVTVKLDGNLDDWGRRDFAFVDSRMSPDDTDISFWLASAPNDGVQITIPSVDIELKDIQNPKLLGSGGGADTSTQTAVVRTSTGWIVEATIPLKTSKWNIRPAYGKVIGFNVHLNDDDDGGRIEQMPSWSDLDVISLSWQNTIRFADLTFAKPIIISEYQFNRVKVSEQMLFTGVPLAFALLHLFLYLFYPRSKTNLYYAVFTGFFAAAAFIDYQADINAGLAMLERALSISVGVSGIRLAYSIAYKKLPRQFFFFVIVGIGFVAWALYNDDARPYTNLFSLIAIMEVLRVFFVAIWRKKDGVWIIGVGALVVCVTAFYEALMGLHVFSATIKGIENPSYYAILALLVSMSVYLSRNFAQTNNALEKRSMELRQLNVELEDRVQQRTAELAEANQGLERRNVELKQTQNQLVQSEKMATLGNLVAIISHEVNNPIGAVNSAADVSSRAITKITGILEASKTLNDIKNNRQFSNSLQILQLNNQVTATAGDRIAELVSSLKNFAKLDEAEFQKANIHEGIDSTLTLIQHELKDRIEVIKEYGALPNIFCYPNQLNQVFMNLIVNGVQSIEDKGTIKITTSADETNVYVKISDTGKGIPAANLVKIFDPSFTTKSTRIGIDLGLSTSYNIIQKHKGEIKAKSEIGKGTEFAIVLPIEQSSWE